VQLVVAMLPRKGSNSYRTIHPLPALNSPSHSGSGAGGARRVGGLDLAMAALGYAHSIAVIGANYNSSTAAAMQMQAEVGPT